ncbi:MAG: RDD family protein [Acidobacteria bacterium]|nr:RDD family protein [Acidobacteriota bacterium]
MEASYRAPGPAPRAFHTISTPSGVGTVQISQARTVGLPRERLWLRALALGIDLFLFAGLPLLLSAFGVFLALLVSRAPSQGLDAVFHAAQVAFVIAFLVRDHGGASPGKRLLGLRVVTRDRRPPGLRASVLRNLPLVVPLWNLAEVWAVLRHPDMLRNGDRIAGTHLIEES